MSDSVANETSKMDWVTKRSQCSLPNVFRELTLQVEGDVKTRNGLRPNNSPYEFSATAHGDDFTVLLETVKGGVKVTHPGGAKGDHFFLT